MRLTNKLKVFILLSSVYSLFVVPLLKIQWQMQGAKMVINDQLGPALGDIVIAIVYGSLLAVSGYLLSRTDKSRQYRGNLALLYHRYGAIVASLAALTAWFLLKYFGWRYAVWVFILSWGSYGIHWLIVRDKPKGINKKEAFK